MEKLWDYTKSFGMFWYNFIVGDDWTLALAVAIGIAGDIILYLFSIPAWYVMPIVLSIAVAFSAMRQAGKNG